MGSIYVAVEANFSLLINNLADMLAYTKNPTIEQGFPCGEGGIRTLESDYLQLLT
tara:strand:- start:313 stop:477 length:165 start_codon:yes stop_codon:yes gene_type:complete